MQWRERSGSKVLFWFKDGRNLGMFPAHGTGASEEGFVKVQQRNNTTEKFTFNWGWFGGLGGPFLDRLLLLFSPVRWLSL